MVTLQLWRGYCTVEYVAYGRAGKNFSLLVVRHRRPYFPISESQTREVVSADHELQNVPPDEKGKSVK